MDYAEISRRARRIVDANRAKVVEEALVSEGSSGETRQPKLKYTRSTKGCMACRRQKVKCDETLPACLRCVAGQRECDYVTGNSKGKERCRRSTSTRQRSEESPKLFTVRTSPGPLDNSVTLGDGSMTEKKDNLYEPQSSWDLSDFLNLPSTTDSPDLSFFNDLFAITPAPVLPPIETSPSQILPQNFLAADPPAASMPQFANLGKSLLAKRRSGRSGTVLPDPHLQMLAPIQMHPRMAMIDSILRAFESDQTLFEFGPSRRSAFTIPGHITAFQLGTDVLSNGFPSPSARTLFHHYCNVSSRYLVAFGNSGPNPLLALCTHNRLLDTNSAASAAMRMSILSISVAHLTYETVDLVGETNLGVHWPSTKARLVALGAKLKKAAISDIFMAETTETTPDQVDCILAACTFLCIRDVISADPTWADNMQFVIKLAHKKGGPDGLLQGTNSFIRRYLLENLAVHDVFSCFSTGQEPALLGSQNRWWHDIVQKSQTRWEWESVERTFGISRTSVDLVARVVTLDSRKRRLGIVMSDHQDEMMAIGQHFVREAHCLLLEADIWGNSLCALPQHPRVTCGDYIYKSMVVVIILADVLEQPINTPRIAKSIDCIIELCSEATAMRMSVMLAWPILIAGLYCDNNLRSSITALFESFQYDYCEDLKTARAILDRQWKSIDSGQGRRPWREIMKALNSSVMLI